MVDRDKDGLHEDAIKSVEAHYIEIEKSRRAVISEASRMIDALTGNLEGVKARSDEFSTRHSSAPTSLPVFEYGSFSSENHIVGNIGEYYARRFSNNKPAAVFNAGFYAGVLATKAGLINPNDFHTDQDKGPDEHQT